MTKKNPREILNELIQLFTDPKQVDKLEDTVRLSFINSYEKPCNRWSFSNQFLMIMQGTNDARGYRQWQLVGRNPTDWTKTVTILVPLVRKIKKEEEEKTILSGFKSVGLFAVENTYGKPLDEETKKIPLPPLTDIAEKYGCKVRYEKISGEYGHYSKQKNEIVLGTENHSVFFHELAHLIHAKIDGDSYKQNGQNPEHEAVAQLTSCVLSRIYGFKVDNMTYQYIAQYSENHKPESVGRLCLRVAEKTAQVLNKIMVESQIMEITV